MAKTLRAADCLLMPGAMIHMLGRVLADKHCPPGVDTLFGAGGSPGVGGMPPVPDDGNYYMVVFLSAVIVIGATAPSSLIIKPDLGSTGALGSGPRTENIIAPRLLKPNTDLWVQSVTNFPTGTPLSAGQWQFTLGFPLVKGQALNPGIYCRPEGAAVMVDLNAQVTWAIFRATEGWAGNCCLLYTSPSPRDLSTSRMPSSA